MSNLQNEIATLTADEKFELLDILWESLEADVPPITDAQREELDRRLLHYDENPPDVIPWEQVRASLPKRR
jgi:putative addiction module component (TIGR02574 family)